MTARKKASKAPAKKKAGATKAPVKKKTGKASKAPARKAVAKKRSAPKASVAKPVARAKRKAKGKASAADVNLGHIFALRPAVPKSYRQEHFRAAKLMLQDEAYASIGEAARAVAEKALELTHDGPPNRGLHRRR